jgi:hypothetical protein
MPAEVVRQITAIRRLPCMSHSVDLVLIEGDGILAAEDQCAVALISAHGDP